MKNYALNSLTSLLILSSIALSPVVTAAPKNNQQLTDDIAATQQSLGKIEADMKKLNRLLDNRAMLELFQRMDDLADEVSSLRGMLEQQTHDLSGLKKRQRELYLDTDRRLRELEITSKRAPAPVTSTPPVDAATSAAETSISPASEAPVIPAVKAPSITQSEKPEQVIAAPPVVTPPAMVSKPATLSGSPQPPMSEEREEYQKAFDMLKEGRYKMASAAFHRFIKTYPQSSYAGNSQYWLGEANYVTRQFQQAVEEFRKVLDTYPTSNKVPDAMLKLGYTYYELRDNQQAKTILDQLRKLHPKTTAARLAGKRLERMRKEGL